MSGLLERRSYDSRSTEVRRLVIGLLTLLLASTAWYVARPLLIFRIGRSSVGCPTRQVLIAAALRLSTPAFPSDNDLLTSGPAGDVLNLSSRCVPPPGWVTWQWVRESVQFPGGEILPKWQLGIADHLLQLKGTFSTDDGAPEAPPGDMDADGRWEVVCEYEAVPAEQASTQEVRGWAVIRLGEKENEITWAGLSDFNLWSNRGARIKPMWRDGATGGMKELVFVTVVSVRLPGRDMGFRPPETVAVFGWDRSGGVLRSRTLPRDKESVCSGGAFHPLLVGRFLMETLSSETESVFTPEQQEAFMLTEGIWESVTGMMDKVLKCRGQDREIDFQEYLDVVDAITVGELMLCLTTDDDIQLEIVNEWVDELESNRLDATDVLDE